LHELIHTPADDLIDLTESNPTRCGFVYPTVSEPLLGPRTWAYEPEAQGRTDARRAVAALLVEEGAPARTEDIVLTASTSEAYAMLLKLLCDPGDAVATGAPSYPLVPHLAELEAVGTRTYHLELYGGRWHLDLDSVETALDAGCRALVLISPNNPTGSCPTPDELDSLAALCNARRVPVIVDAVFAPYGLGPPARGFPYGAFERCVVLGGLSKAAALPQLKLGWMSLYGDRTWVTGARQRLEWIADTYLSVNTPVQVALPQLLAAARPLQAQVRQRLQTNRAAWEAALRRLPEVDLAPSQGGWCAVLRLPQGLDEDTVVVALRRDVGVLLHPGYFYDFARPGYLVSSLLPPAAPFAAACVRVIDILKRFV
jgi:alanine-synthesizing transaminase